MLYAILQQFNFGADIIDRICMPRFNRMLHTSANRGMPHTNDPIRPFKQRRAILRTPQLDTGIDIHEFRHLPQRTPDAMYFRRTDICKCGG